jgi:hypothetical protein
MLNSKKDFSENEHLQVFLNECNLSKSHLTFLESDASKRYYIRVENEKKLIMYAPPSEKPEQFIALSRYLNEIGLAAPKVYYANPNLHFYLIEDFGTSSFHDYLDNKEIPSTDLYLGAVDVLKHLYKNAYNQPAFVLEYDEEALYKEASLFLEWYLLPTFHHDHPFASNEYSQIIRQLIATSQRAPKTLALRDYHIDNIMIRKEHKGVMQFGLIDFQDALWGPSGYDLISLTDDARVDVDADLKKKMLDSYLLCFPKNQQQDVLDAMTCMNIIRQLKILGIFKRLYLRDNKSYYLNHLPRVERLLKECLLSPIGKPLYEWMKAYELSLFV